MTYAVIDRRQWKVVELANVKKNIHSKGLIVDIDHLERCPQTDLVSLYKGLIGNRGIKKPAEALAAKLRTLLKTTASVLMPSEEGPVAKVRRICESMKGKSRKEIIEACVAEGINEGTARTQYQKWHSQQS